MTHNELLAKINEEIQPCGTETHFKCKSPEENLPWQALRTVVELHMYFGRVQKDLSIKIYCIECSADDRSISIPHPCPTIQAIQEQLK